MPVSRLGDPMGVRIDVPGLDQFVEELPDGRILVVEGGMDATKSYFACRLAGAASAADRPVTILTSRDGRVAAETLRVAADGRNGVAIQEIDGWATLGSATNPKGDLLVDSFSFLALGAPAAEVGNWLRDVRRRLQETGRTAILTLERGMLDERVAAVVYHLADGILQFHVREDEEGVVQFLRIPKWMGGESFPRNIYYTFDGRRLLIDTRNRVN